MLNLFQHPTGQVTNMLCNFVHCGFASGVLKQVQHDIVASSV
ncbi:hypothetical protein [Mucilaginibacter dorajii]|nr:hypothetical protein [Mucilaginibacter dorajii]MCS3735741.1 hypothetical protein [Mucilaginibacter dorajii]